MYTKTLTYESIIKTLLDLAKSQSYAEIRKFKHHSVLKLHEVAAAVYLCAVFEETSFSEEKLSIRTTSTGAVLLFQNACFLWGGLPYPAEHAELGLLLLRLSRYEETYLEIVERMIGYQQATSDHRNLVFSSLYRQEKGRPLDEINMVNRLFLSNSNTLFDRNYTFLDEDLGFWMTRSLERSAFVSGSGCKSGMGAFLTGDTGVVNFGVQFSLPEDASRFGISGRVKNFQFKSEESSADGKSVAISYGFSPAYPKAKESGFKFLEDSGSFGGRFYVRTVVSETSYRTSFSSWDIEEPFVLSVFCIGSTLRLEGGAVLRAGSPDSYKGPSRIAEVRGLTGRVSIECLDCCDMEIFALPGGDVFWGADFIIVFRNLNSSFDVVFQN